MLYGSECWALNESYASKVRVAEMRMLRWMSGHTKLDKVCNESIREKAEVVPIEDKLREERLRWFGHVKRRHMEVLVRQVEHIRLEDKKKKKKGRPKLTWRRVLQHYLEALHIFEDLTQNRLEWRKRIHRADPKFWLS